MERIKVFSCLFLLCGCACYGGADVSPDADVGDGIDGADLDHAGETSLVCVFDIDSTLTCSHAFEAVRACKDLGVRLAVNTAESRETALDNRNGTGYVDWDALGFPLSGKAVDLEDGAFMFGLCSANCSCSEEFGGKPGDCEKCASCGSDCPSAYMGKAYGMSRIAEHYDVADKTCLVLLDDLESNTSKVELFGYSAYHHGSCAQGWNQGGAYEAVHAFLSGDRFTRCRIIP